jgi:signal transduction histidine kinase
MIRFLQNHVLVKTCIALFLLLVFVFSIYSFVNSEYYSDFYTSQLEEKINDTVDHTISEINHHSASMEQQAGDLAQAGELFYRMRETATTTVVEAEIFRYLIESFAQFPYAIGGGLWYEPWVFAADKQYFGPYVYRENGTMVATWDLNTPEYDYHNQDWYTLAIPLDWDRTKSRAEEFVWTPPYRDEAGSFSEMITVDAFMHDDSGKVIGISTVDWSLEWMQDFLAAHRIFENSHVFLVDQNSNTIIANTLNPELVMQGASTVPWFDLLEVPSKTLQQKQLLINDIEYQAYYILTDANMVYSIIIPVDEINASVLALQKVNMGMLAFLGFSLFVLMTWVLIYILRPIVALTELVRRISNGDFDTRIKVTSHDEIGVLGESFNIMADRIKSFQEDLKKKVDEKTVELFSVLKALKTKNTDLERSQLATINLLEDLEEEKRNIGNKIIERTNELQLEKNKLLQVTSHMRGGGVLFDINHRVIFVNTELYKLLSIEPNTEHDRILDSVSSYFGGKAIKEHLDRCFGGESFHVKEISGGGRIYEIYFHYFAHTTEQHTEIPSFFMLIFDITDFKLLEHSKSELISVASHQLRTPLTAMRGNVEMLIDESFGALNKEQHELLDDIEDSTLRLITMVNDMLDITKIERNDFEMNRSKINIHHLLNSVIGDLTTYANQHEITIDSSNVARDVIVEGDEVRLRQVFQNLIDNAIKYGRNKGKIQIATEAIDGAVEITFKDDGIGIPKNEQSKIFARFYRATNTSKSTSSGSGLGLYIVRAIVQQHGGDITFESGEGEGTTFIVRLPFHLHTIYRKKTP